MANEAVIVELLGNRGEVLDFTIADAQAVAKGTLMKTIDPRACSGASAAVDNEVFAGIAASEKVASDGQTRLGLYTKGIFDLKVNSSVAVTLGAHVCMSGANLIRDAVEAEIAAGAAVGIALETGSVDEVIQVAVGVY